MIAQQDADLTILEMSKEERDHLVKAMDWYTEHSETRYPMRLRETTVADVKLFGSYHDDIELWREVYDMEHTADGRYFLIVNAPCLVILTSALTEYAVKGD